LAWGTEVLGGWAVAVSRAEIMSLSVKHVAVWLTEKALFLESLGVGWGQRLGEVIVFKTKLRKSAFWSGLVRSQIGGWL
jgi:hypothetical protein